MAALRTPERTRGCAQTHTARPTPRPHPPVTRVTQADVINRGYAGYNTRWAQFAVPEISEQFAPGRVELATVWFGANDADDPSKNL